MRLHLTIDVFIASTSATVFGIRPSVAWNKVLYKLEGTRKARMILSARFIGLPSCTPSAAAIE
eukprot:11728671-Prorocentrum_lima.AAC.1